MYPRASIAVRIASRSELARSRSTRNRPVSCRAISRSRATQQRPWSGCDSARHGPPRCPRRFAPAPADRLPSLSQHARCPDRSARRGRNSAYRVNHLAVDVELELACAHRCRRGLAASWRSRIGGTAPTRAMGFAEDIVEYLQLGRVRRVAWRIQLGMPQLPPRSRGRRARAA